MPPRPRSRRRSPPPRSSRKELEQAEERLFALRALARKHKVMVDDLPALVARLEAELAALETSETRAGELAKAAEFGPQGL